ncbi:hypothetical protein CcrJ4_gp466 [Caulobacter phage J4]|nr:hypothetical protein CcrJ4_gp466 [Caulobacter phage J4]UTU09776.1 hypothetical protein CcrBL47_gp492 [Caulobacter phage BL47]UTU10330.1 hypothetical protein CcrRB23_gp468 [Caulobacter phage RB23]
MATKPRPVGVRGHTEIIEAGGTRVRFFCPHGHTQIEDLGRKSLPISKRLSPGAVKLLARVWGKGHAGVTFTCKACTKENHALSS